MNKRERDARAKLQAAVETPVAIRIRIAEYEEALWALTAVLRKAKDGQVRATLGLQTTELYETIKMWEKRL